MFIHALVILVNEWMSVVEDDDEEVFSDEEFEAELKHRQKRTVVPRDSQVRISI